MHKSQFINIANRLLVFLTVLFLNYCSSTNMVKTEIPVYEYPPDWKDLTITESDNFGIFKVSYTEEKYF